MDPMTVLAFTCSLAHFPRNFSSVFLLIPAGTYRSRPQISVIPSCSTSAMSASLSALGTQRPSSYSCTVGTATPILFARSRMDFPRCFLILFNSSPSNLFT